MSEVPQELPFGMVYDGQELFYLLPAEGAGWEAFNPLGSWPRVQRALVYGQNQVPVRPPSKLQATRRLLLSPLILAQVLTPLPNHPGLPL